MMKPTIDADALFEDLDRLNELGSDGRPGINRIAFSPADMAGRDYVEGRMRDLAMEVRRDPAGNSIGRLPGREGSLAPIALGSHTDTVPEGGRYDGALGVVAALACARALVAAGVLLRRPLEVIDFVAEEATMPSGTLGSRAMSGQWDPRLLEAPAFDGRTLAAHVAAAGIDPEAMASAARPAGSLAAYLELHIEQGGVLEAGGTSLGVVEGIVGIRRYGVVFEGRPNHAGTTPMAQRQDALVQAAPFITGVREVAVANELVGTVGTLQVHPGAPNVIPGRVDLSCEIRGVDESRLERAEEELLDLAARHGGRVWQSSRKAPVRSSPRLVEALEDACRELGASFKVMPSGAGHDAMCVSAICEQAMLFVPSQGGISHAPDEHTTPEQCLLGATTLLAGLLELDRRLDAGRETEDA